MAVPGCIQRKRIAVVQRADLMRSVKFLSAVTDFLAVKGGELFQKLLLPRGKLLGHLDVDLHQLVAPAV